MRGLIIISTVLLVLQFPYRAMAQLEHPVITYVTLKNPENSFDVNIYWEKQEPQTNDSVDIYWGTKVNNVDIRETLVTNIAWSIGHFTHKLNSSYNNPLKYWIKRSDLEPHLTQQHQTVFLSQQNYDTCQQSLSLIWTNYVGWVPKAYNLYCKKGNESFEKIYTTTSTNDTVFIVTSLEPGMNYRYYVVAESPDGKYKSMSNLFELTTHKPVPADPEKIFIDSVVNLGASVFLHCQIDTTNDLHGYIWQKGNIGFDTVPQNKTGAINTITDFEEGNVFKVAAIDLCDKENAIRNEIEPMVLHVDLKDNIANLTWNDCFYNEDETFTIHVIIDNSIEKIIGPAINPYKSGINLDQIGDDQSQEFCFWIVSKSNPKGSYSISNRVCIIRNPFFEIANAFTPNGDGKNDNFGPVIKNADITSFEFIIYDRYGGRVFSTENQSERWDGSCKGTMVSEGGYLYYIKLTTSHNQTIERKGAVNVVYP